MDAVGNREMSADQRATAHGAIGTDGGAACHGHTAGNRGIAPNAHVVANLNQVVELDAVFDDRIAQCATVNTGVGPDFNVVANPDGTQLLNFFPAITVFGKTEAIRAYHHARVHDATLADDAVIAQADPGGQFAAGTHAGTALHHTQGTDTGASVHLGLRVDYGAGVYPAASPGGIVALPFAVATTPELGQLSVIEVGVRNNNRGAACQSRVPHGRRNNNASRLAFGQCRGVTGVAQKTNLVGLGTVQWGQALDGDLRVP